MTWSETLALLPVVMVPLMAVMGGAWAAMRHSTKQNLAHIDSRFDAQAVITKAGFDAQAAITKAGFDAVDKRIDDQTAATNKRFDAVDKRFDAVDRRFDAQTAAVDKRFDDQTAAMNQRFSDQTAAMNQRFDAVDKRIDAVDKRIDAVDLRVGELRSDLRALSNRIDTLAEAGAGV